METIEVMKVAPGQQTRPAGLPVKRLLDEGDGQLALSRKRCLIKGLQGSEKIAQTPRPPMQDVTGDLVRQLHPPHASAKLERLEATGIVQRFDVEGHAPGQP